MNIKKYMMAGGALLGMALSSCVGDLDLKPNDPNYVNVDNSEEFVASVLAKCYSGIAVSGQGGAGSSDISGLDNGTGCYSRAIFMMNEFPTDETLWIWMDASVADLCQGNWDASNGNIYGTYSRLYAHIATCNDFLTVAGNITPTDGITRMMYEARTLRALSYYWVLDIFGKASFVTEETAVGELPVQISREKLYTWLEKELKDIVDNGNLPDTPVYGRIGKDAPEALLARLYLNAEVYTDGKVSAWDKCQQACENIIARHKGAGFNGSGLVNNYLYLFCGDNHVYTPGGGDVNEILWGIPYDRTMIQSYGGTTFILAASTANESGMSGLNYGTSAVWKCMHARQQFSEKFDTADKRWSMWVKGTQADGSEYTITNDKYSEWTNGYGVIKFTNLLKGDGQGDPNDRNSSFWAPASFAEGYASQFADTDLPLFRLAEVYLMYAESYAMGKTGDASKAVEYINYVRNRAGLGNWGPGELTPDNVLNERCRELYWELTRRSDLVRHNKFAGPGQDVWSWKNGVAEGNNISERYNIMPIPTNIIAAQPDFKQNAGY